MKNKLMARILGNEVAHRVIGTVSKFYVEHESTVLTCGTIGFSTACTWVTYINAPKINNAIFEAKAALEQCNYKEERAQVYKLFLKELAPLVAPIIIFQSATIGCAIFSKKQADKKLAEAAGALSIAQAAIAQYQSFQKEAEEALGEKKYEKLQSDIYKNQEVDGRRFTALASEGAPGDVLMIDKYSGRPFWSSTDRVVNAARELSRMIGRNGSEDIATIDDFYGLIGNPDLTAQESELATRFGYAAGMDDISVKFADTHYRFPNGTVIPAFEVYLYPEPACLDWDR